MSPDDVKREVDLPAEPDAVWRSVTDPEQLGDWLEADVELDPRPGGTGSFRFADGEVRRALVRDVEPGRRLEFTWWPLTGADVGQATTVTISIEPADAGTHLRLVESPRARARARATAVA
ncbi:MAG TPA: SRPBCC domain-containing protein [Acidimicrobiia bacterium]|nr:SRPBCC domain-containing protein [Acidimicrobiia bacterium]